MDKKSFIRGFGVGVLFTAVILGTSAMIRTSDSYVRSRAEKLGMVEESEQEESLFVTPKPTESKKTGDTTKTENTSKNKKASESSSPTAAASEKKASKKQTEKMESEKKRLEKDLKKEEKKLTITDGEWSSDVSKNLEEMGIIEDSKKFDTYLNQNGYSNSINSGTYDVSVDDTYKELAKKITGKSK